MLPNDEMKSDKKNFYKHSIGNIQIIGINDVSTNNCVYL
jgi:hypothetical protein